MIHYFRFKQLWRAIENDSLNIDDYLQDVYWRSMLTEEEIRKTAAIITEVQNAKTFAEFLLVFSYTTEEFADTFDRDIVETERWMHRETDFPIRMKQSYAFMMITNYIAAGRQHTCRRCDATFLSTANEDCCKDCRESIENQRKLFEEPKFKIQLEMILKTE